MLHAIPCSRKCICESFSIGVEYTNNKQFVNADLTAKKGTCVFDENIFVDFSNGYSKQEIFVSIRNIYVNCC